MAYTTFTLEKLQDQFGIMALDTSILSNVQAVPVSSWLRETLHRMSDSAFKTRSEKARSEFIIAPILTEILELNQHRFALFSGQYFDVEPETGLSGECDFLLTLQPKASIVSAPVFALIEAIPPEGASWNQEAKKQDIEAGLGQCAAQMLAAQKFNTRKETPQVAVYGCVTTGEIWQFLKLQNNTLEIDTQRYYLNELELLLGALQNVINNF
jgi:hypothetical protein